MSAPSERHLSHLHWEGAKKGLFEWFRDFEPQDVVAFVTPLGNSILHIHIMCQSHTTTNSEHASWLSRRNSDTDQPNNSTNFVDQILDRFPGLLEKVNNYGETLFHLAAKYGHLSAWHALINHARQRRELESGTSFLFEMLRKTDKQKNTALHLAVLYDNKAVVKLIANEDYGRPYEPNASGETPLYLATEKESKEMVDCILDTYRSPNLEEPGKKTALHAAAIWDDAVTGRILGKKAWNYNIKNETDGNGWTPLHYASYENHLKSVKTLLNFDISVSTAVDRHYKMTALHLAAGQGHYEIMEEIISRSLENCSMVDGRGWNILHFAMCSLGDSKLRLLLKNPSIKNLIHEKDKQGKSPVHVFVAIRPRSLLGSIILAGATQGLGDGGFSDEAIMRGEYARKKSELKKQIIELSRNTKDGPYYKGLINIIGSIKEDEEEALNMTEKAKEYHLIVAILIATVTFQAFFTLPGGYRSSNGEGVGEAAGTPVLLKKPAFQSFVLTNTIAFTFSLSAVLLHYLMSMEFILQRYRNLFVYALFCTIVAIVAMVASFFSSSLAVLSHPKWFRITNGILGLLFFVLALSMTGRLMIQLLKEIFRLTLSWTRNKLIQALDRISLCWTRNKVIQAVN